MAATSKICSVLLCILYAGLCACSPSSADGISGRLAEAEGWIWTQPDSALHLLEAIPHAERLTGKLQADYALLLSHARYRCDVPASSDSLINIAVDYYKNRDDMDRRGRAWYVKGGIMKEAGYAPAEVMLAYKNAEKCIPNMSDRQTVARIYNSIGYLNTDCRNHELAKMYYQKALQINLDIKDTHSQISNLINCRIYIVYWEKGIVWIGVLICWRR